MTRYHTEIAKLIIYNSQKSKDFVSCFVAQPKLEEERLGRLFIIAEIKQKNIAGISVLDCQKFIDNLITSIKRNYYSKNTDEFAMESIELLFEAAIQKTNRDLQAYLLQNDKSAITNFLDNTAIIIGVTTKHQAYFSGIGKIEVFLARKNKISDILAASQKVSSQYQREKINQAKIFSHLIAGNMETDDGLIFCTPTLLDYFSLEKIKRIVKENSPNKAIQNFNSLLAEIDEKTALAGIVIKLASGAETFEKNQGFPAENYQNKKRRFIRPEKENARDSIAELLNRQEETNRIITPAAGNIVKKIMAFFFGKKLNKEKQENQHLADAIQTYETKSETRTQHFPGSNRGHAVKKKTSAFFGLIFRNLTKLKIGNKNKRIRIAEPQKPKKIRTKFASKAILIFCIIFGILFIQSLFTLNKKRVLDKNNKIFSQRIDSLEQEKELAGSRLIIGDKLSAIDVYENILETMKEIPAESIEQEEQIKILKKGIEEKINEINKIKKVDISKIIDLGELTYFTDSTPEKIIKIENNIFISSDNGTILKNDLATGEIKKIGLFDLGKIKKIKAFDENNLIINYNHSLALFDLESGISTPLQLNARADLAITDFEVYNNRLYILDAGKNTILQYSKSGNSFSGETIWLKDDTNVREATAISIDGSIWVIYYIGKLENFMKGVKTDLAVEEALSKMVRADKVWTGYEQENVYFIDTESKRIAVITKLGKIVQQYVSDKFEELKDFAVDETAKKIFILDGTKIYSFDI